VRRTLMEDSFLFGRTTGSLDCTPPIACVGCQTRANRGQVERSQVSLLPQADHELSKRKTINKNYITCKERKPTYKLQ
jgi:hypothetical protein